MKNEDLITKICIPFCSFYKEGKEEMLCRGADIFRRIFSHSRGKYFLSLFDRNEICPSVIYQTGEFLEKVCKNCEFYITGCDFTDPDFKRYSPPCGGYIAIVSLIKEDKITLQELLDAEDECRS